MPTKYERIPLPLPWGGIVYPTLIEGAGARVLIDCGHTSAASRRGLLDALGGKELDALILTHGHQDHYGGLPALSSAYQDLPIYAHHSALEYYQDQAGSVLRHKAALAAFCDRCLITPDLRSQLLKGYNEIAQSGCGAQLAGLIGDGDRLQFADLELHLHHHPGHHHHHLVIEVPALPRLITGDNIFKDHLTPPEVLFDEDGQRIPCLPTLLQSLRRLAALGGHALPSHGPELPNIGPTSDAAVRAYERTAKRVTAALQRSDAPPPIEHLLKEVFGEVPGPLIGLRIAFLLGYLDLVGAGDDYR